MDGLECSEVLFSELERTIRIDSEFYAKESFKVLEQINKHINYPLTDYVDISDGNHMAISDRFIESGIPYYRGQDVKSFFIENNSPICIDEDSYNAANMKRSHLQNKDIILSIVGTIGSMAIVYSNSKATCSCKLAILRPKQKINAEFIAIFLNCKYGQNQIKKFTRGTVQMGLILQDMNQLIVPDLDISFQKAITRMVISAFENDNESKHKYSQAEQLLLSELGMTTNVSSEDVVSIKTLSESFLSNGRLDAEYYQPKYDKLFEVITRFETKPLGEIVNIKKSIEPGSNCYGDNGIPFVRVSDITKFGISEPNIKLPLDVVLNTPSLYPKKNTVLLSKDGSIGIAYKLEQDMDVITSSALLHLKVIDENQILPDYLTLVLNSPVVQLQAERDAGGSIIHHWKPSEIKNVIIPILDMNIQTQITDKIQKSFTFRRKSEQLIETAKQAVEMAIEQDEKKAVEWLEEKGVEA